MTLDRLSWFIGQTARPMAILSTAVSASISAVIVAQKVTDGNDGAIFIGAVFAGVGALYGFKAWERRKEAQSSADVEIARSGIDRRQPQEVIIKNEPGEAVPVEEVAT